MKEGGARKLETLTTRYVVWAAGGFQYPKGRAEVVSGSDGGFDEEEKKNENGEESTNGAKGGAKKDDGDDIIGSHLCLHNSEVRSFAALGDSFVIIGGYESGIDAAVNLARAGKKCTVLASNPCWRIQTADLSEELAPHTAGRLREVMDPAFRGVRPKLMAPLRVVRVDEVPPSEGGGFNVTAVFKKRLVPRASSASEEKGGEGDERQHAPLRDLANFEWSPVDEGSSLVVHTPCRPLLCTGFEGSIAAPGSVASGLFEFASGDHPRGGCLAGAPLLTAEDESTKVPGIFLAGPSVRHGKLSFCFVYKFRQRFAVVSNAICRGLGIDTRAAVAKCRSQNMYLDDFATCEETCGDVC